MNNIRVDYTSAALHPDDCQQKIEAACKFCDTQGWTFGIQVHNTCTADWLSTLGSLDVPLSYHAPLLSKYFMNLANEDKRYAWDSANKTADLIQQHGGNLAVYHGFLMTDVPVRIFGQFASFDEAMRAAYREELSQPERVFCRDFLGTQEFAERFERVKARHAALNKQFPQVTWCIEDDYPVYGAGMLLAEQMAQVGGPLCLDISHQWIASLLFGRDFHEQVEATAQTGQVRCVHFHANPIRPDTPIETYRDGHQSLATPNCMDLPRVARILQQYDVTHLVLETPEADLRDLQLLSDWLS